MAFLSLRNLTRKKGSNVVLRRFLKVSISRDIVEVLLHSNMSITRPGAQVSTSKAHRPIDRMQTILIVTLNVGDYRPGDGASEQGKLHVSGLVVDQDGRSCFPAVPRRM